MSSSLTGPFLPCNDLFDWWTLRCSVWIVFLLALLGNGCVVIVLVASRGKMDVPRFLVCNLAAADFFMGLYLGFLAVVDASTLGEFRKFALPWQFSAGCQAAGEHKQQRHLKLLRNVAEKICLSGEQGF